MATTVQYFEGNYNNEHPFDAGLWPQRLDENSFVETSRKRKVSSMGNPQKKRRRVNAAGKERERLRAFNDALESLQSVLPIRFTENRKMYKKQTLQLAIRYIQFLRSCAAGERDWSERSRFWCGREDKVAIGAMDAVSHSAVTDIPAKQHQTHTVVPNTHYTGHNEYVDQCESLTPLEATDCSSVPLISHGNTTHSLEPNLAFGTLPETDVDSRQHGDEYLPIIGQMDYPETSTCPDNTSGSIGFTRYHSVATPPGYTVVNESFTSYQSYMQGRCIELTATDKLKTNPPSEADLNDIPLSDLLNSEAISEKRTDFKSFDDEMLTHLEEILSSPDTSTPSSPESGFASFSSCK